MLSSNEAFTEFKKLFIEEYGDGFSDIEIKVMGARVIGIVDILNSSDAEMNDEQRKGEP